jgi:hypothetical protein
MDHSEYGFLKIEGGLQTWTPCPSRNPRTLEEMQEEAAHYSFLIECAPIGTFGATSPGGKDFSVDVLAVFDDSFAYSEEMLPSVFAPSTGMVLSGPVVLCRNEPEASGFKPIPLCAALACFATGVLAVIPAGVKAHKPEPKITVQSMDKDGNVTEEEL